MLQTAMLTLPFGTSGPTPGRPISQYGGSAGAEELPLVKLFNDIEGFPVCQLAREPGLHVRTESGQK